MSNSVTRLDTERKPASAEAPNELAVVPDKKPEPEAKDFDWNADDDSIILHEQPATAVYFNADNSMVIRQHRWPDDDAIIIISSTNIPEFLDKLTDLNLKNRERERLGIRTIAPVDMTAAQLQEQRRAKKRARDERRRRAEGRKPRESYLANSLSKKKPWEAEGISRRSWYRNQNKQRGTGLRQIKLTNAKRTLVPRSKWRMTERRGLPRKVATARKVGRGVVRPLGAYLASYR